MPPATPSRCDPTSPTVAETKPHTSTPAERRAYAPGEDASLEAKLDILIQRTSEGVTPRRQRRQTYTGPAADVRDFSAGSSAGPGTGRPSSSWVRRLSTITSSVYGSSISGSRPHTPSINSSTTPLFPSAAARNPPNKLVKRSTSQRAFLEQQSVSYSRPATSSSFMRRPATSHQRSAAMRHRSATESRVVPQLDTTPVSSPLRENHPDVFEADSDDIWRPYFNGMRETAPKHHTRQRSSSIIKNGYHSKPHCLIRPDAAPTLLLASSILKDTPKPHRESHFYNQTPERVRLNNPPRTRDSPSAAQISCSPISPNHNWISHTSPRSEKPSPSSVRSTPSRTLQRDQQFFSCQRGKTRANITGGSKSERLNESSVRSRRRRNITDPDVFERPSSSSQVEFISERTFIQHDYGFGSPKRRLRHLPQYADLRNELLADAAKSNSLLFVECRQPRRDRGESNSSEPDFATIPISAFTSKRLSSAASDPPSTLPGSENDNRVFTSGEEDETDFQSDSAFDSFPRPASNKSILDIQQKDTFDHPDRFTTSLTPSDLPSAPIIPATFTDHHTAEYPTSNPFTQSNPRYLRQILPPIKTSVPDSPEHPMDDLWASIQYSDLSPTPPRKISNGFSSSTDLSEDTERSSRMHLFDWSEQKETIDGHPSTCRPRTSYEKSPVDPRGGRTPARSVSNSLHHRSKSVPLSKDPAVNKDSQFPLKFGTWGLGNKGPSEHWDGDFDFEDSEPLDNSKINTNGAPPGNTCDTQSVRVPQAILDRQESVHGQYGQVQELTVLVEELKRLRVQAKALHIMDGPSSELWKEAQGIINLAMQDESEDTVPCEFNQRPSPSSDSVSLMIAGFDADLTTEQMFSGINFHTKPNENQSSPVSKSLRETGTAPRYGARLDTSAKAQLVLHNVNQQQGTCEAIHKQPFEDAQQRLAFDTQSLKDLVVRAGVVTRALKEIVRNAEGVLSPTESASQPPDPPFSQIFIHPTSSNTLDIHQIR